MYKSARTSRLPFPLLPERRASFPTTDPFRRTNSDFPEFCLKCLWTVSEGSDTTRESASMSREGGGGGEEKERGNAARGTWSSRGELSSRKFTQPDPEIGAEGSHILSHGAVNLGRTQIKFRARDEPPERKECVISLRLYERRHDQRSGNPESPIRLIERQARNVYLFK